jgi:hypothetical protein
VASAGGEFGDPRGVDVDAGDAAAGLREGNGQWKSDIARADDRDLA